MYHSEVRSDFGKAKNWPFPLLQASPPHAPATKNARENAIYHPQAQYPAPEPEQCPPNTSSNALGQSSGFRHLHPDRELPIDQRADGRDMLRDPHCGANMYSARPQAFVEGREVGVPIGGCAMLSQTAAANRENFRIHPPVSRAREGPI
jgi:hypothetical protein